MTGEALSNTRVISDKFGALSELAPDLTVVIGLSGAFNAFHEGERPAGTDPRPGRSVGTKSVALPGSARAFSGKNDEEADKKKKKERGSFRQVREVGKPDDALDEDDVLDRRRRGLTVDEKRLKKKKAEAKDEEKAKEEEKDGKKDGKDPKKDDGKKGAPKKGVGGKAEKKAATVP